jgi:ATP-dependent exoDNAse (exonuclease V) beta subunit
LHDPAFGIVCKYRDKNGDWQEPASYQWGKWTNARLEVAENKRLLYVACTRAADLLILSGKLGKSGTWLHDILQAWNISVDDDEEIISHETHAIRVLRPSYEPPSLDEFSPHPLRDPGLDEIPPLARRLPKMKQTRAMAVTQLAQILQTDSDPMPDVRPVVWAQEGAERVFRAPAYLIGRVVHRALADWECVALPSDNLYDRVAAYAQRDGITAPEAIQHAAARSIKMLGNLRKAPLYTEICRASQRYPELPFTLTTPLGTLHGVIDLLYEDIHGQWHIIDWKTEWVPKEQVEEHAQEHINQLAIYAEATQTTLGITPKVALCFLYPSFGQHLFQPDELDAARAAMYG